VERVTIDTPGEYVGTLTQALATRRGRLENLVHHDTGWARMEYVVPSRGLIGFRTEFLTETRGTGVLNHNLEGYEPWLGDMRAGRPARWSRPAGRGDDLLDVLAAGARPAHGPAGHGRLRGHDRR
jgi:Predicted membrane GTPase involved in stress response